MYIVGDIHGHADELLELLQLLDNEFVIFVGDIVHKGPNSARAVGIVREIVESGRGWAVRGNHDNAAEEGEDGLTAGDVEFLKGLPLLVRKDGVFVVHGGLCATTTKIINDLKLPVEGDWDPKMVAEAAESLSGGMRKKMERVMYVRYVTSDGTFRPLGTEKDGDPLWAEWYGGQFGFAVGGHSPAAGGGKWEHAAIVDGGVETLYAPLLPRKTIAPAVMPGIIAYNPHTGRCLHVPRK